MSLRGPITPVEQERTSPGEDSIAAFIAAVRAPFTYLVHVSATAAERTAVPVESFVRRAESLGEVYGDEQRRELHRVAESLREFAQAPPSQRRALAERCLAAIEGLERRLGGTPQPATSEKSEDRVPSRGPAPRYVATGEDPAAALEPLGQSVQFLRGVGPRRADMLGKFGIATVLDLLYHLPFRYEDRRRVRRIASLRPGDESSVIGELVRVEERVVGRARRQILEAVLRDDTGLLGLTWYHGVSYFRRRYRTGQKVLVHGKVEPSPGGGRRIVHPEIELDPDEAGQGILPVYGKPAGMSVRAMRDLVAACVDKFAALVPSVLPEVIARQARVCDLATALRAVHCPRPESDVSALDRFQSPEQRSLVFDELFFLHLGLALRRRAAGREDGIALARTGVLSDRLLADLPFSLTGAQQRVIEEILRDMRRGHPMQRLLQGDVGSGKTLVALVAALVAIENGRQAAFMAPTELLAEQHFDTVAPLVEPLGVRCALITGDSGRRERRRLLDGLAAGEIQLAVGTHALIQEGVRFRALGLAVIDEQHRFGVLQRAALRRCGEAGVDGASPDTLLMTATPIPRTLSMTLYGDLDVSLLDEMPPGRKAVRTLLFNEAERTRVYSLASRELAMGRQGYVVYPLVDVSEKEDLRDATSMADELARTVFPGYRVGLVHGRMKAEEKDGVMRRFRAGDVQLLVCTTVIEVGVDVPNATIMIIEHAERFGLAQLHQLRGRVGRGCERATCVLVAPYHRGEDAYRRLKAMTETNDGFRIAEIDLRLRGPGEFLGTRQSGLPDFRVANLLRDSRLLAEARTLAERWLQRDPTLERPESARLRSVLEQRWGERLGVAQTG